MARTRPANPTHLQPSSSAIQHAVKSTPNIRRANKTTTPTTRPDTAQKTPAHLYQPVPQGSFGGKSYTPIPPRIRPKRHHRIVAPPLRAPKPIKRGSGALHEIRYYQNGTGHLIPKKPFARLVREIAQKHMINVRLAPKAIDALQEAAETFLIQLLSDANLLALHARRVTVQPRDLRVLFMLRRSMGRDSFLEKLMYI